MFERTKAFCDSFLNMGVPGVDLTVYRDGACILRHMGGYSDLERRIPVNGSERYHIYSCSKPITCAAAMQLWERGLFSLEDPLCKFLPEFAHMTVGDRPAEKPILIRHLFEMTAGFSYDLHSPHLTQFRETGGGCPTRDAMGYLAKEPLLFEPGTHWQYSLCHDVLAALVEVLSGQSFEDYVQDHIFRPLGMTQSTFLSSEAEQARLARQYIWENGTARPCGQANQYRLGRDYASGGAGCVSTVDDYMKFLEALRAGETILKRDTIALMATDRLTERQRADYDFPHTYGYGLGLRTPKQGAAGTDFGWSGAAGSYLAVDIPHGLSIFHVQHMLLAPNRDLRPKIVEHILADLEEVRQ